MTPQRPRVIRVSEPPHRPRVMHAHPIDFDRLERERIEATRAADALGRFIVALVAVFVVLAIIVELGR